MKNRPHLTWAFLKGAKTLALGLCLVGVYGCGDKENKVSGNVGSGNGYSNNGPQNDRQYQAPSVDSGQGNQFQQIKSSFRCRQGQRLSQDVTFSTQGYNHGGSRTTISGPFQPGPVNGKVSQIFVGVSAWNDVMIVSRVGSGSQVRGYNITLSMCSYSGNGTPFIHDSRPLSNFQASNGIILDSDNHCNFGSVDAAKNTIMQSAQTTYQGDFGNQVNLPAFTVYTTFYKPSCNSNY